MKHYFQLNSSIVHLNHAAVAPWPLVTRDAVIAFARENAAIGSQRYTSWLETERQLKEKMALLINAASVDEIAILKNTSEGLSLIAQGIDFRPGDNIVIPAEEFPSNKVVWQALQARGINVRLVPIQDIENPEQALLNAIDENTRLLSCSSVQYARGLRLKLEILGNACRQHDILFCIDAIQSLGATSLDVQACQADFVVADGHKWMCGPEGTALFYCRQHRQDMLRLSQYGWHMLQGSHDLSRQHDSYRVAASAQRFECGSPNMMGITALNASLGLLLDIGIDEIERQVIANSSYLFEQLHTLADINMLTPTDIGRYAGIVTFQLQSVDNMKLYRYLQDNNVLCACRGDGIRFSPHFYTGRRQLDTALQLVNDYYSQHRQANAVR